MADPMNVVVYSSDATTRRELINTIGGRPDPALPGLRYTEIATAAMLIATMDQGRIDLAVLDGEAVPVGGLGIARQLRDELAQCPMLIGLLGRPADQWLAKWARVDAAVTWPSDPIVLTEVVVAALRQRTGEMVGDAATNWRNH